MIVAFDSTKRIGIIQENKKIPDFQHQYHLGKQEENHQHVRNIYKIKKIIEKNLDKLLYASFSYKATPTNPIVIIFTHRQSLVAEKINFLKNLIKKAIGTDVEINLQGIDKPEINPAIIARKIAEEVKKKANTRAIVKRSIIEARRHCQGIKIHLKGRLSGRAMADERKKQDGKTPSGQLTKPVTEHLEHVSTKSGMCSVRVRVCE